MEQKKNSVGLYVLCVFSLLLPWFTYNPDVMGYCRGYAFLKWFLVPMVVIGIYLLSMKKSKAHFLLCECSLVTNLAVLVVALGRWQETCNIQSGFHWEDGFRTALPTYWISAALFLILFVVFQVESFRKPQQ